LGTPGAKQTPKKKALDISKIIDYFLDIFSFFDSRHSAIEVGSI
jgi:hypothetical protein